MSFNFHVPSCLSSNLVIGHRLIPASNGEFSRAGGLGSYYRNLNDVSKLRFGVEYNINLAAGIDVRGVRIVSNLDFISVLLY